MTDNSGLTPKKQFRSKIKWMILGIILVLVIANLNGMKWTRDKPEHHPTESYQIISYEFSTNEWVIIALNKEENTRVKITAICDFFQWGNREANQGPASCNLRVGETLFPNRLGLYQGEFLDVWQLGDKFFVTRGSGGDRVHQQFSIQSKKLLSN